MADYGLFIGWGENVAGRERQGTRVLGEALAYIEAQQQAGVVESHELGFLGAHGGDLQGFVLVRGERDKLAGLVAGTEWQRLVTRSAFIVHDFGVVPVFLGDEARRLVGVYEEWTKDLA